MKNKREHFDHRKIAAVLGDGKVQTALKGLDHLLQIDTAQRVKNVHFRVQVKGIEIVAETAGEEDGVLWDDG